MNIDKISTRLLRTSRNIYQAKCPTVFQQLIRETQPPMLHKIVLVRNCVDWKGIRGQWGQALDVIDELERLWQGPSGSFLCPMEILSRANHGRRISLRWQET
ncbi:hypothetical protein M378DRAFT_171902 [Amanita muscaria Koide BX008]|uniref:Uncharacterized protein n=1 Tax=Amanita muscaria (strain Koide BX008) TaxID=946122 RepID=A0A0C2W813_AMAMK|nr:hypothetical protein M378DRAFT_171902 [Amanita muscaria Koide BX008]